MHVERRAPGSTENLWPKPEAGLRLAPSWTTTPDLYWCPVNSHICFQTAPRCTRQRSMSSHTQRRSPPGGGRSLQRSPVTALRDGAPADAATSHGTCPLSAQTTTAQRKASRSAPEAPAPLRGDGERHARSRVLAWRSPWVGVHRRCAAPSPQTHADDASIAEKINRKARLMAWVWRGSGRPTPTSTE